MCPRSVALPRFSRTTHTARAAKRSNFSYSQRCTTGHRPTASRYNNHHHRCRASATASSVSSSIKVINQTILITISTPPPQRPLPLCRHATRCQVLPKKYWISRKSIFQRVSYIFSEPRAVSHSALQEIRREQARPPCRHTTSRKPLLSFQD